MFAVFEKEKAIAAAMAVFFGIGLALRVLQGILYLALIRETEEMATTGNRLLKQCKLKFANCYRLNDGVANIPIFVEKFLNRLAIGPLSFGTMYHLSGQAVLLSVVCAGAGVVRCIASGGTLGEILPFYIVSFLGLYVYFSVSSLVDLKGKRQILKVNLIDYLENHLAPRMETTDGDLERLYGDRADDAEDLTTDVESYRGDRRGGLAADEGSYRGDRRGGLAADVKSYRGDKRGGLAKKRGKRQDVGRFSGETTGENRERAEELRASIRLPRRRETWDVVGVRDRQSGAGAVPEGITGRQQAGAGGASDGTPGRWQSGAEAASDGAAGGRQAGAGLTPAQAPGRQPHRTPPVNPSGSPAVADILGQLTEQELDDLLREFSAN